jgi:DNA end-binding protein Ku
VAPRAYWKGFLRLSLVSCPIALFPATTDREKISFHQLNKETSNRIRYRKVDAETGDEVEQASIIKGYEVPKGDYIELDPEELEAVAIKSKHTIEIDEFVPKSVIDELYMRDPYYIVPDCEVGQQAFAVIRDATILADRNDDKFSQKVRNLKSHETLEKRGIATFKLRLYHITPEEKKSQRTVKFSNP